MAEMDPRRYDYFTAREVDRAIRIADAGFREDAALLCVLLNIPIEIALRVLTRPSQRRTYSTSSLIQKRLVNGRA